MSGVERGEAPDPPRSRPDTTMSASVPRKTAPFQFRLGTLFLCTAVYSVFLALITNDRNTPWLFWVIFLAVPLSAFPLLFDRCLRSDADVLRFRPAAGIWLALSLGVYSVAMLSLATIGFVPDWQGRKGHGWIYYINDGLAGLATFPLYITGAIAFSISVVRPTYAARSHANLLFVGTNAVISWWYVFATIFLNFTQNASSESAMATIPLAAAVGYTAYAIVLAKYSKRPAEQPNLHMINVWAGLTITTIAAKIPLAMHYYASLPADPPSGCFIVTAASRGHRWLVRSWRDPGSGAITNWQLCVFREFENCLRRTLPRFHRRLRSIYNRVGPPIAALIRFRWQADLVFLMLLPIQLVLAAIGFGRESIRQTFRRIIRDGA